MRLKSREKQIPGGFVYYVPQIPAWRPQPWSSLDSLANQVLTLRQANPFLTQKHGWSLDKNAIVSEIDSFNAAWAAQQGWDSYIIGGGGSAPPNPRQPPSAKDLAQLSAVATKARQIWIGVKTINEWLDAGSPAVAQELAESRAATCVACPQNGKGDFTSWFTTPAAEAIKRQVEKLHDRKLATEQGDKLGVCEICLCPMKVKVFLPIEFIKTHTNDETMDNLRAVSGCWIPKEISAS